jgi:hypothetical protein
MLVRPFVSRVCLFFVVSLPACDCENGDCHRDVLTAILNVLNNALCTETKKVSNFTDCIDMFSVRRAVSNSGHVI